MRKILTAFCLFFIGVASAQEGLPTPAQIRNQIAGQITGFNIKPATIFKIENLSVWHGTDSIPVRIYYPGSAAKLRIIFNIHGGALVAGDLETHENISRQLSIRTNSVVVALDYRRPPEAPFPASLDDCETVLVWIKEHATRIHGDAANLVITGDSGGGLFATALAVKLKSALGAKAICLINPAADLRSPGEGFYGLVTNWDLNGHDAADSLVSPVVASDFSSFPPTLIITSGRDELKWHGDAIYEKIKPFTRARIFNMPLEDHLGGFWAAAHPKAMQALEATIKFIKAGYK